MNRKSLNNNEGMVFLFNSPSVRCFWMKDTFIPLDILMVNQRGVIVEILTNMVPHSKKMRCSKNSIQTAIELRAGICHDKNIKVGDKITLTSIQRVETPMNTLEAIVTQAWDARDTLTPESSGPFRDAIIEAIDQLNTGKARVSEKHDGKWLVNTWLKQAVLMYFRLHSNALQDGQFKAFDKVPLKCANWSQEDFQEAGFRLVPGGIVRTGSYIAPDVVVMPSFINIGAHVGSKTMVDSGVSIGSCAQIGTRCHISSNAIIGGVLEPLQATPTIIEDNCFIGAGSMITEGVIVEEGTVIGSGVIISASTPIINRETGKAIYGRVPANSVVVPGTKPAKDGHHGISLNCAVIIKNVSPETRAKTDINELLRG